MHLWNYSRIIFGYEISDLVKKVPFFKMLSKIVLGDEGRKFVLCFQFDILSNQILYEMDICLRLSSFHLNPPPFAHSVFSPLHLLICHACRLSVQINDFRMKFKLDQNSNPLIIDKMQVPCTWCIPKLFKRK